MAEQKHQNEGSQTQQKSETFHILRNYGNDVASIKNGAHGSKGCIRPNTMLRENWTEYTGNAGFTYANNNQHIVVNFRMAFIVNTIKFLLWDQDNRHYDYVVEVSRDQTTWTSVAKASQKKSWQEIQIKPMSVKYVRLYGTGGSGNHNQLHIVKFMTFFDYSR